MEDSYTPPDKEPIKTSLPQSTNRTLRALVVCLVLAIGAALVFGIYHKERTEAASIVSQNSALNSQVTRLDKEIKQQQDINNGIIPESAVYKDPKGGIGLINGAITFKLPNGWERIPQSSCTGGSMDSKAVCQDIAGIAPDSLVNSDGTAEWSTTIGVFSYDTSDGNAKSWYESTYFGDTISSFGVPLGVDISEAPINGYSALSFQWVATPLKDPDYTNAVFVVVHGKYGVVISAQIQAGTAYGVANAFDYRTTFLPELEQMVKTIKFQN